MYNTSRTRERGIVGPVGVLTMLEEEEPMSRGMRTQQFFLIMSLNEPVWLIIYVPTLSMHICSQSSSSHMFIYIPKNSPIDAVSVVALMPPTYPFMYTHFFACPFSRCTEVLTLHPLTPWWTHFKYLYLLGRAGIILFLPLPNKCNTMTLECIFLHNIWIIKGK